MRTELGGLLVAITLLAVIVPFEPVDANPAEESGLLAERGYISITKKADFSAANGVTQGSGTAANPYVIEGWNITLSTSLYPCIQISGTSDYFIIRNVSLHSMTRPAIDLTGVSHGKIVDSRLECVRTYVYESALVLSAQSCTDITVSRTVFVKEHTAIQANACSFLRIENCTVLGCTWGITLTSCSNAVISNNPILRGTTLDSCVDCRVSGNGISQSGVIDGIGVVGSRGIIVENNRIGSGELRLENSVGIVVHRNTLITSVTLRGSDLSHFSSHTITSDNTIDGKPILYFKNESSVVLDNIEAGQVIIVNCTGVTVANSWLDVRKGTAIGLHWVTGAKVANNTISGTNWLYSDGVLVDHCEDIEVLSNLIVGSYDGVNLEYTDGATVMGNNITGAERGICPWYSSNIVISGNDIVPPTWRHITMRQVSAVSVYHNNFFGIGRYSNPMADDYDSLNIAIWDAGKKYGGNFFSDYSGIDTNGDGFGDTNYSSYFTVGNYVDRYPLMVPYPVNKPPKAAFTVQNQVGAFWDQFSFDASVSSDLETVGAELEVRWDWEGDGVWDTSWSTVKTASHQYLWAGQCDAILAVRDGGGFVNESRMHIVIEGQPVDYGVVRVVTNPPVDATIYIDGKAAGSWSIERVKLTPGGHVISFGDARWCETPSPQTIQVVAGRFYQIQGNYTMLGTLKVHTPPGTPTTTIYVDGIARNDRELDLDLVPGTHYLTLGPVEGWDLPQYMPITIVAGQEVSRSVILFSHPGSPGPDPATFGVLRVVTNPALPSTIKLDGISMNRWGLDWVKVSPGTHVLTFTDLLGWMTPDPITVNVPSGGGMVNVTADFTELCSLRVTTEPPVPSTISIDGSPAADWGTWIDILPGSHVISFGPTEGFVPPEPVEVTLIAGQFRTVTGIFVPG